MPSSRSSARVRYPPPPSVEEEPTSLARELHGLSKLGEKPGVEGARARGTVDQYPVIVDSDYPPSSPTPSGVSSMPGLGIVSSDDSSGPMTPPPNAQEPAFRTASRPPSNDRYKPTSASSKSRGQPPPQTHRQSSREPNASRQPRSSSCSVHGNATSTPSVSSASSKSRGRPPPHVPQQPIREPNLPHRLRAPSHSRDSNPIRTEAPVHTTPHSSRASASGPGRTQSNGPEYEKAYLSPSRTSIGRSNSARYGASAVLPAQGCQRQESPPGYLSDSATTRNRAPNHRHPPTARTTVEKASIEKPSGPTLAERIEEKLRLRQERRDSGPLSDTETRTRTATVKPIDAKMNPSVAASAPHSPSRELHRTSSHRSQARPPGSRPRAATVASAAPPEPAPAPAPQSTSKNPNASRPVSSDEGIASSSKPARQLASVKFQELEQKRSSSQTPSRQTSISQRSSNTTGLCLTPCPRSIPMAGRADWYTLKGLTHIDVCPSCMGQIAHSRFRDFFIPSLAKPPNHKIRCAFANPWTRLAWTQMIKKKHDSLEMLYQMTRPPPGTRACPGRIVTDQTWYRIVDPDTGMYLPRFHICSNCARNVRILMPSHRDTFHPSPDPQERVCDFVTTSPRFIQFIDLLDSAASRAEADPTRRPDTREFLAYARRKVVLRDCRRDRHALSTWHYIPSLPELSVCEDCYDEVVWPLAKAHHPIARMFLTSMRLLPGDGPNRCREASCQLYSGRMRARFRDAVVKGDFAAVKSVALRRFEAERRFRDRREELLVAEGKGYDCDEEMRKAVEEWRRWE